MSQPVGGRGIGPRRVLVPPRAMVPLVRGGIAECAGRPCGSAEEAARRAEEQAELTRILAIFEAAEGREEALFSPRDGAASLLQSYLTGEAAARGDELRRKGRIEPADDGIEEVKFDRDDLGGWTATFFSLWRKVLDRHPWVPPPEEPYRRIPGTARIALLGDWGTGRYGAPVCAAAIERTRPPYDVLVHLGDVYYSGTPEEVRDNFLAAWPRVPGALSIALNSNHEMYSGGRGYFEHLLPSPLFHQPSSAVAVENDCFLLVGLDTAYSDGGLAGEQAAWLRRLVERAAGRGQKVVLLSHHQPFSLFEGFAEDAVRELRDLLEAGKIFAWYWAHEHRALIYDRHEGWGMFGRCFGHGGFPYRREDLSGAEARRENADGSAWCRLPPRDGAPAAWMLDGPNVHVRGREATYGPNGYASLLLDGPRLVEMVHAADGQVLHRMELV